MIDIPEKSKLSKMIDELQAIKCCYVFGTNLPLYIKLTLPITFNEAHRIINKYGFIITHEEKEQSVDRIWINYNVTKS